MGTYIAELAILSVVCASGILLTALRLPGIWLIVAATVVTHWYHSWPANERWVLYVVPAVAVVAEIIEIAASSIVAQRAGASKQAAWGALIGGFLGMFLLALPLLLVGSMIGAILGCFLGAGVTEMWVRGKMLHGAQVGFFAAVGMVLGTVAKIAAAFLVSALLLGSSLLR